MNFIEAKYGIRPLVMKRRKSSPSLSQTTEGKNKQSMLRVDVLPRNVENPTLRKKSAASPSGPTEGKSKLNLVMVGNS